MREGKRSPPPLFQAEGSKRDAFGILRSRRGWLPVIKHGRAGRSSFIFVAVCRAPARYNAAQKASQPSLLISAALVSPSSFGAGFDSFRAGRGEGGSVTYTCLRRLPDLAGGSAVLIFFFGGEKKLRYRTTGKGWAGKGALHNFFEKGRGRRFGIIAEKRGTSVGDPPFPISRI